MCNAFLVCIILCFVLADLGYAIFTWATCKTFSSTAISAHVGGLISGKMVTNTQFSEKK